MNQVSQGLFVGGYRDTANPEHLYAHQIEAMLLLDEDFDYPGIDRLYLPVPDGAPLPGQLIDRGVQFVLQHLDQSRNVLVACGLGVSRSSTFALATLRARQTKKSTLELYREMLSFRPQVMPHPTLWNCLCRHYNETSQYHDVLEAAMQRGKTSS